MDAAIKAGADMLLTHHPLIFKAIKKVNDQNFITRRLVKLVQADISYYACTPILMQHPAVWQIWQQNVFL